MQDLTDGERKNVLGEILFDELRAIREMLESQPTRIEFNALGAKVDAIGKDVAIIKAVVKDHSRQLSGHEQRLTVLETA